MKESQLYVHQSAAERPDWEEYDRERVHVHDWRTYVPEEVRAAWESIPLLGRCAVVACCEVAAGREEWD